MEIEATRGSRSAVRILAALPVVRMFLVCAAFIATAAGVVQAAPAAAPVAPSARIVLVDDTGAKVTLAGPARRIVSLSAGATELLFAAGAGDRIVATVTGADEPVAARRIERIGDACASPIYVFAISDYAARLNASSLYPFVRSQLFAFT
jgi:hypothetical protein